MREFNSIYPFTTENISGYLGGSNFKDKKVITTTASTDHIVNLILAGATDITTFDINDLTKYYMELKLSAIENLSFEEFLGIFLFRTPKSFDSKKVLSLPLSEETKTFFREKLKECNYNGEELKRSSLFHISYFDPNTTISQNPYLSKRNYKLVKKKIKDARIKFINTDIRNLELAGEYDYMFLSNIADYINEMFKSPLKDYQELMEKFLEHVKIIYMAYLYDLGNNKRSDIYDLERVRSMFRNLSIETFRSVYDNGYNNKRDAVLILKR